MVVVQPELAQFGELAQLRRDPPRKIGEREVDRSQVGQQSDLDRDLTRELIVIEAQRLKAIKSGQPRRYPSSQERTNGDSDDPRRLPVHGDPEPFSDWSISAPVEAIAAPGQDVPFLEQDGAVANQFGLSLRLLDGYPVRAGGELFG